MSSSTAICAQEEEQLGALLGLEIAGGLVAQQDARAADDGAGERGALALGGREDAGARVAQLAEADAFEQRVDGLGRGGAAGDEERQRDVLGDGDRGEDRRGGEEQADAVAPQAGELEIVEPAQRAPVERHGPAGRAIEAGEEVQEGGLA